MNWSVDMGSDYVPAFVSCWPGVATAVELNSTSSLVLAAGEKPFGVCACARPASAAIKKEEVNSISKGEYEQ